jgi:hypothetical protein
VEKKAQRLHHLVLESSNTLVTTCQQTAAPTRISTRDAL